MKCKTLWLALALLSGSCGAYTVQKGDTLFAIASANGVTVDELRRLNDLNSNVISVGQVLRISGTPESVTGSATAPTKAVSRAPAKVQAATGRVSTVNTGLPPTKLPAALPPEQLSPTPAGINITGVDISVPDKLTMGEAFIMRLTGAKAGEVTVSFPSELGENVRRPNEILTPVGAAGEYRVLGRVVLGNKSPVVYQVKLGDELIRGKIPVAPLNQTIQHLNLPPKIGGLLKDPGRSAEEKIVESAYELRTPQAWSKPFAPALLSKAVSSSFGQPRTYLAGGPVNYHYGLDYPAPAGTAVRAVNDGTVVIAGKYPVRGNLVAINHGNGLISLYFHQSKVLVKVGDKVTRGQKIGLVGTTGLSAGPHLHLEMRVRGEGTNPQDWIGRIWPR